MRWWSTALLLAAVRPGVPFIRGPFAGRLEAQEPAGAARRAGARPWRLGSELAFTDISGNRQLQLFQATINAQHVRPDLLTLDTKAEARYGESQGTVAAASWRYSLRFDYHPNSGVSPFIGLDAEYDRIRRIDSRLSGGMGANFNLTAPSRARTVFSLGLIAAYERREAGVAPRVLNETRYHARISAQRQLREGVVVEYAAKYQPATAEMSDYLLRLDGSLRVALSTKLSLRLAYRWDRDSTPAPGVTSKDDRTLTTGFQVQWQL